jgi:3-oxoacyl-[acyl-carrier-protein] synthase-3
VVVRAGGIDEPGSVTAQFLGSDGDLLDIMKTPAGGSRQRSAGVGTDVAHSYFTMAGRSVYKHAINRMTLASTTVLERMGWGVDDVDWLVAHQANRRILTATAEAIGIPAERAVINVDKVANTSAASIPLAFVDAVESGAFAAGDKVLLAAFGGGATWAAAALTWPELTLATPQAIS